ncbi:MAG: hypothetical protein AAB285_08525 [candidate division NC10 bacterium]
MKQRRREKLSVTLAPYRVVGRHAACAKVPKSKVVEDANRVWERSRLRALAREGYQKTADEDFADAEAYLSVLDDIGEG